MRTWLKNRTILDWLIIAVMAYALFAAILPEQSGLCPYTDPCTGEIRYYPCDWIDEMPTDCWEE